MKRTSVVLLMAMTWLAGARLYAHHSQAAVYDTEKTTKLEGDLAQIMIRSPHSFVHVMAKDDKGVMQRWAVEWAAAGQLNRAGVEGKTLKVGDHVIITGHPGRNAIDHRLIMQFIERPADGWTWGNKPGEVVD
jgi:hypothetical protein